MNIGFIGLGAMGSRMAANLVRAGHHVRVWNRSPGPAEELARLGAEPVASARDAFRGDAALSMLADDQAVREVIAPLLDDAPRGLVHVNLATVSVALAREMDERHRARGLTYVAAPVFGRPDVAAAAKLTIVAAGDEQAIAHVEPLLGAMGQRTWRVGAEPARANVVKLAGNLMLAAAVEAMAEASAIAQRNGVAAGELLDVLTTSIFTAPAYRTYGTAMAEQRFEPAGFRLRLALKDVRLALEAAGEAGADALPLASAVRDALREAIDAGDGDRDLSALARVAMRHAGATGAT